MANIKDVAKKAGVGIGTVSRVINNSDGVSDEARKNVLAAIKVLNYVPNEFGRNLKTQESKIVALFVPQICHQFFSKIAYHIENYLYEKGYKMLVISSQEKKSKELELMKMIEANQVDGIILITTHEYPDNYFKNVNVVTIDRSLTGVPCVCSDNYDSTINALTYLYNKGCKNIGYIGGKASVKSETQKRFEAYNDFTESHKLNKIYCYENVLHGEELKFASKFIEDNKELDAIFAQSDTFAYACYQTCLKNGIDVPNDMKIIAFDGVLDEILQHPKFTVVKQDVEALAYKAVDELYKKIKKQECDEFSYIKTNFIIGETTE